MTDPQSTATRLERQQGITPAQASQEKALLQAIWLDALLLFSFFVAVLTSGSLTVLAEALRGSLLYAVEIITLITMWRSNRGKFVEYEYGIGKLERVITIAISCGLYYSAIYTFSSAMGRVVHPTILPTTAMIFAVVVAAVNLGVNLWCTLEFIRSNEKESSLLLASQIKSRLVKTINSVIVVLVLVLATWIADPKGSALIDAIGGFIASIYMAVIATELLRESLPDLVDRALPEQQQLKLLGVVTRHFDHFDQFDAVRSRQSGGRAFIEMNLKFDPDMPLRQVNQRCQAIEQGIVEAIPGAIVTVTPRVADQA